MSKERILHILSGDLWAGRETQLLLQLAALRAQGWDAEALLFNEGETAARFRDAKLPVAVVNEKLPLRQFVRQLAAAGRERQQALVVAHGYKEAFAAFYLARLLERPWISVFHGGTERYSGIRAAKKAAYLALQRALSRWSAAAVVTVSRALAKSLRLDGYPRLHIIYNVAGPGDASPRGEQLAAMDVRQTVAVVGRLVPVKRVDRALRAFSRMLDKAAGLQSTALLVIGDGPLRYSLEQLRETLPHRERIHFLGARSDAALLLAGSDLLLIASDSEGVPTVLLEAAAACVPVVSTDVGGIREALALLPGYPAELVPPAQEARLAEAIERMLLRPPTCDKRAISAEFARHFLPDVAAQKHGELYRSILGATSAPSPGHA